jgi:hypothetical protein
LANGRVPYEVQGGETSSDDTVAAAAATEAENAENGTSVSVATGSEKKRRDLMRTHSELVSSNGRQIYTSLFDPVSCLPVYVHKAVISLNHDREYERSHGIGLGADVDYNEIVPVIPTIATKTKKIKQHETVFALLMHRIYLCLGWEDEHEEGLAPSKLVGGGTSSDGVQTSLNVTQECYFPREWRFIHIFDYFASVYHYEFVRLFARLCLLSC